MVIIMRLEYDITTYEASRKSLSQLTNQSERQIEEYIMLNSQDYSAHQYLEEFHIDESMLLVKDIWLTSLHVTTNNDKCSSLQKYGLLNLQHAISLDTPFYQYLRQFDINFDLLNRTFSHKGKTYDISKEMNGFSTDDKERDLEFIVYKLFNDYQINGFFSYDNALTYGGYVNRRPEFLYNLAEFLNIPNLLYDWERNNKCYVIKFVAPISDYADWTFMNKSDLKYLDQHEIEIKKRKWLINETLSNMYDGIFYQTVKDSYSYLRNDVTIPYSNFTVLYTEDEYIKTYGYESR